METKLSERSVCRKKKPAKRWRPWREARIKRALKKGLRSLASAAETRRPEASGGEVDDVLAAYRNNAIQAT